MYTCDTDKNPVTEPDGKETKERQTDRQTDRQKQRQTDRDRERETDRDRETETDRQTDKHKTEKTETEIFRFRRFIDSSLLSPLNMMDTAMLF